MVLAGCWELLKIWRWNMQERCITIFELELQSHLHDTGFAFPSKKRVFSLSKPALALLLWVQTQWVQTIGSFPTHQPRQGDPRKRALTSLTCDHMDLCLSSSTESNCWARVPRWQAPPPHTFPVKTQTKLSWISMVLSRHFTRSKF